MDESTKKILREQLQLLSELSQKKKRNPTALCNLSRAMLDIIRVLNPREIFR